MTSLTTHKVTPNLIAPMDLRRILEDVTMKLVANIKMPLPVAKNADIWSYYQFSKIDAFVHRDMLIVILILPNIDKDLQFYLFKAHSVPLLHPQLKKVFTYNLESFTKWWSLFCFPHTWWYSDLCSFSLVFLQSKYTLISCRIHYRMYVPITCQWQRQNQKIL